MEKKFDRRWHQAKPGTTKRKKFVTAAKLRVLVSQQLEGKLDRNFGFYIADEKYYCTPLEDANSIIAASAVDRKKWVEEEFDCDDFAHVLKAHFAEAAYADGVRRPAHCFGIVWGMLPEPHAINWMINDDSKLRFIEPQTDEIFELTSIHKDIWFMLV